MELNPLVEYRIYNCFAVENIGNEKLEDRFLAFIDKMAMYINYSRAIFILSSTCENTLNTLALRS